MHIPPNEWYDDLYNSSYQNKKNQSNKMHVCIKATGSITENSIQDAEKDLLTTGG